MNRSALKKYICLLILCCGLNAASSQTIRLKSRKDTVSKEIDLSRIYGIETNDSGKIYQGAVVALEGSVLKFRPLVKDTVYVFKTSHVQRMWYCNKGAREICAKKRIWSGKVWKYALFFIIICFIAALVKDLSWTLALSGFIVATLALLLARHFGMKNILDMKNRWKF